MSGIEEANREIEQAVRAEWNDTRKKPLLIAKLGMNLSSRSKEALAGTGIGLKRYLEEHLADLIRVTPMKGRGGAAAPADETRDMSDEEIEALYFTRTSAAPGESEVPQYWVTVWKGFQSELPEGNIRYLIVDAFSRPRVIDAAHGSPLPDNAKIIDRNDLVLAEAGQPLPPRITVHRAIESWCGREHIPLNSLLYERAQPLRSETEDRSIRRARQERPLAKTDASNVSTSSLMKGIDLLNREELARINIPADLVLAMLERSGSR